MELTVGAIVEGTVKSIANFGAFITLPEGTAKLEFGDWLIRYWSPWH